MCLKRLEHEKRGEHKGDEQLVLNQAATMSLFDTGAPTHTQKKKKKPLSQPTAEI